MIKETRNAPLGKQNVTLGGPLVGRIAGRLVMYRVFGRGGRRAALDATDDKSDVIGLFGKPGESVDFVHNRVADFFNRNSRAGREALRKATRQPLHSKLFPLAIHGFGDPSVYIRKRSSVCKSMVISCRPSAKPLLSAMSTPSPITDILTRPLSYFE